MPIKIIPRPEYIEAVMQNVARAPAEVKQIISDRLRGFECYLWGGAVREPVYHSMYNGNDGNQWRTLDWDLLVDDSDQDEPLDLDPFFREELRSGTCSHNRYGTIKWKPRDGLEIDVSRFSNANMIRRSETSERSIVVCLASCDFNTGSIAYGIQTGILYEDGAMDGLRNRVVDLKYADDEPHILMARLIMHSKDMRFAIGPAGIALITNHYTHENAQGLNKKIFEYLHRKGKDKEARYEEVINRLRELTGVC
jgi:hypothetical protein